MLTLIDHELWVTFSNGTVAQFSANTGDAYDYFTPSVTPGDITTTFSLSNTGTLLWTSPSFFNGNALFCVLTSGVIVAVFEQGAQPTSCIFIDLTIAEGMWPISVQCLFPCLSTNRDLVTSCVVASSGSAPPVVLGGQGPSGQVRVFFIGLEYYADL